MGLIRPREDGLLMAEEARLADAAKTKTNTHTHGVMGRLGADPPPKEFGFMGPTHPRFLENHGNHV